MRLFSVGTYVFQSCKPSYRIYEVGVCLHLSLSGRNMSDSLKTVYPPTESISKDARIPNMEAYEKMYKRSINDNEGFWREQATSLIDWFMPFNKVQHGDFENGDVAWFLNGKLNLTYNCLDRHIAKNGDKVAILFEGDEPGEGRKITYKELLRDVCKFANALKRKGVKKGDAVCIYMPMVPEAAVAMLACARIGAPHSVVFAGFSEQALRDRIVDCNAKVVTVLLIL